ncbi:hypothetical protein [Sphingobium sp. BS19]|uniref:hypothetical protein n=1 Tax=Sphingobium sp. BS19 TaxID=3018973 RepID=UPI0022EF7CF0|nr:hypothetical protein [Sphingobium sp. BS19]GLI99948.1 hypothetical protein Sbs19_37660 [Sphingobium sp. BS19]
MSREHGTLGPLDEREITDPVQREAVQFIRKIANETGLSATQIARTSGLSPSTLTRMYPVPSVSYTLTSRSLSKIKRAFPMFDEKHTAAAPPKSSATEPQARPILREIPVYAFKEEVDVSAASQVTDYPQVSEAIAQIEGWRGLNTEPISQTGWLQDEHNQERFFGVFVAGDGMYPRLCPGEIAIVDTVRPAGANCDALITLGLGENEEIMFFAYIVERRGSHVTIRFHANDEGRSTQLPRHLISQMLPVMGIVISGR